MPLPLDGITVVSIEQAVAAPFATRQLADLGARVIKIERPDGGDFARGPAPRAAAARPHGGRRAGDGTGALARTAHSPDSRGARLRSGDNVMAVKQGWMGRVFEDFQVGDVYEHPLGRTVIAADNIWFTCMTMNTNPIHFDAEYAAKTEFGRPLVNSCFTLALVTGQSVTDLTMNAVANLGWDEVRLPHPLFEGDTVRSKSEVLETRESKSRPNVGIVRVKTTGMNQDGKTVIEFARTFMIWKRGHVPS
jgi:acyl dehydratase